MLQQAMLYYIGWIRRSGSEASIFLISSFHGTLGEKQR
ncbi:hypothetical protein SD77_1732 [Bacillus badius]|uniref:Uncharacterized protein n=1 Tax=Bacillus badius TaxID=1455 RepID=A0ABR5AQV4_BACBA|nr:hypothetical protein SD78_4214 [Bacillus badius]KIL77127.1 hypothetical protein SD77_1732 [Bacillus badius]